MYIYVACMICTSFLIFNNGAISKEEEEDRPVRDCLSRPCQELRRCPARHQHQHTGIDNFLYYLFNININN